MRPTRSRGHDPGVLGRRLRGHVPSSGPPAGADPNIPYSVTDFLRDQERLIPDAGTQAHRPHVVELSDGRMLVIHARLLQETVDEDHEPGHVFSERYGCGGDISHLSRFRLVLEFLNHWREEISNSGLGDEGEPMEVREELVDYLLRYSVDPQHPEIPRCALTRLLDELGTRWV